MFRRGYYDLDDLLANTLGGWIGQALFISVAFVVTHPGWRKELRSFHRWKRHARAVHTHWFRNRDEISFADLTDALAIAAGGTHSVVLNKDGSVVTRGSNSFGECDTGDWNLGEWQ